MARRRRARRVRNELAERSGWSRAATRGLALAALATGLALGVLCFEPLAGHFAPRALVVERMSVIGAHRTAPEELAAALAVRAGTPVLSLDRGELERRAEAHPWVRRATVTLLRPGRLIVQVTEREAAAVTRLGIPPTLWLVDVDGTPFAPVAPMWAESHVVLAGPPDAEPGVASGRLREGVRIARAVVAHGLGPAVEVEVAGAPPAELPALRIAGGPRVLLGPGELDRKLRRLDALLGAGFAEVERAAVIDLRFGDRMVLRSGPSEGSGEATTTGGRPPPSWTRPLG